MSLLGIQLLLGVAPGYSLSHDAWSGSQKFPRKFFGLKKSKFKHDPSPKKTLLVTLSFQYVFRRPVFRMALSVSDSELGRGALRFAKGPPS